MFTRVLPIANNPDKLAAMATISEAKDIVERISIRYGYLRESLMDEVEKKLSLDARREIDGVRLALETTAAHSVKTSVPLFTLPWEMKSGYLC